MSDRRCEPEGSAVVETAVYRLMRFPDHFSDPLQRLGLVSYGRERSGRLPLR